MHVGYYTVEKKLNVSRAKDSYPHERASKTSQKVPDGKLIKSIELIFKRAKNHFKVKIPQHEQIYPKRSKQASRR